jgi:Holliday junction resolvase RusA-like endonuclease
LTFLNEALGLRVIAYMPIPESRSAKNKAAAIAGDIMPITRPDFENIAMIDGMNLDRHKRPIVWGDDAHIVSAQVLKIYHERPRLRFEVYRWFDV